MTALKRRTRKILPSTTSPAIIDYFTNGNMSDHTGRDKTDLFILRGSHEKAKAAWDACKTEIMRDWIKKYPCTRPWPWWKYDAPKEQVKGWPDNFKEAQRKRLGGIGTPTFEVLSCGLGFPFGIPTGWIDEWEVDYYNGRARDVFGELIETDYKEGDFEGVAYDEDNPPCYESEAVYLERHGLLSDIEKVYLEKHSELLESEKIEFEDDDED